MQIGTLAVKTGLTRDALRFYEKRGLIRSTRLANGYRVYLPETVQLVRYIRTAQRLGFSLEEVGKNLPALWSSDSSAEHIEALLLGKMAGIDQKIPELVGLKAELLDTLARVCPFRASILKTP